MSKKTPAETPDADIPATPPMPQTGGSYVMQADGTLRQERAPTEPPKPAGLKDV